MRLSYYLNEGRSKPLTHDETIKLLENCTNSFSMSQKYPIYRGFNNGVTESYFIDPSKFTRRSMNTDNYYTLLMDGLPDWKNYPKRSKSIICTTDIVYAGDYGEAYNVFPFDGANIAVCNAADIWGGFKKNIHHLKWFNKCLNEIADELGIITSLYRAMSYDDIINVLNEIDKRKNELDIKRIWRRTNKEKFFDRYFSQYNDRSLVELIIEAFNPDKNGFKLYTPKTFNVKGNHEVWTDSPSVLIHYK